MWKFVFHAHLRVNCILFALFLSLRFLLILLRNPKRFYCWSNFPKKEIKFAQHTINMQFNLLKNLIWILFSSHFSFIVMHNLKSRCFEPKVYFLAVGCVCVTHLHLFRSSFAENDFVLTLYGYVFVYLLRDDGVQSANDFLFVFYFCRWKFIKFSFHSNLNAGRATW